MAFEFVARGGWHREGVHSKPFAGKFNLSVLEALLHGEEFLFKGLGYAGVYVMQLGWLGRRWSLQRGRLPWF